MCATVEGRCLEYLVCITLAKANEFNFKGCQGVINVSLEGNAQIRHGEKAGCYFHQNEEVNGQTYWIKVCNYFILPGAVGYS